ncbi:MAG: hypothetical protein WCX69_04255 [Candidatus Paceibacterota bacterium]
MDEKTKKIKRILSQRYQDIADFVFPPHFFERKNDLSDTPLPILINFLRKISFFVNYIRQTEELEVQYIEFLKEYDGLNNNTKVNEIKKNIIELIKKIAKKFNENGVRRTLEKFPKDKDNEIKDPCNESINIHCSKYAAKVLIMDFDFNDFDIKILKSIKAKFERIGEAINRFDNVELLVDFDKINATLQRNINEFESFTIYQPLFKSLNSFKQIDEIYQYECPNGLNYNTKGLREWGFIYRNGEIDALKIHAQKVCQELLNGLDDRICRNTVIERVKNYFELFGDRRIKNETALQKEVERMIFLERYYPISQAQFKKGKLDTLLVGGKDAILVEYKRIKKGCGKAGIKKILQSVVAQSGTYRAKLATFPKLQKEVYVIIFCFGKMIRIEAKQPHINRDGYNYYFVPIDMRDKCASKLGNIDYISISADDLCCK